MQFDVEFLGGLILGLSVGLVVGLYLGQGTPCQPFSVAGKGQAADDERHLWPAWFPLIQECRPAIVFGEQVEAAIGWGWLDVVFSDLEAEGYACGTAVLPACSVGAKHIRQRCWFVADAYMQRGKPEFGKADSGSSTDGLIGGVPILSLAKQWSQCDWLYCTDGKMRPVEPGTFPLAHGIPGRVGRLRAYGNAIVPQVAAEFIMAATDK